MEKLEDVKHKAKLFNQYLVLASQEVLRLFVEETKEAILGNPTLDDKQKQKRIEELLYVKVRHTERCCNDIEEIMKSYGFHESWITIAKFVAIFHDLGRFHEAENSDGFEPNSVKGYYNKLNEDGVNVKNHSSLADHILFADNGLEEFYDAFNITSEERHILDELTRGAIAHHQDDNKRFPAEYMLPIDLKADSHLIKSNAFMLLFDPTISKEDKQTATNKMKAFFAQIMRDVDKVDILYQNYTGEMSVVKGNNIVFRTSTVSSVKVNDKNITYITFASLEDIARAHFMTVEDIMKFNPNFDVTTLNELIAMGPVDDQRINDKSTMYDEELAKKVRKVRNNLSFPIAELDPKWVEIPADIQEMFYDGKMTDDGKLGELQNRLDWTVLTGMCWRLGNFLKDVNFIDVLKRIKEFGLLDKILANYPDKLKPILIQFFDYAKRVLIDEKINEHGDNKYAIYYDNSKNPIMTKRRPRK